MSEKNREGAAAVRRRFERARSARGAWEPLWQECYEFALPPAQSSLQSSAVGTVAPAPSGRLFDGTAPDAVDQLAASLLARLTPPWSRWFGLAAGRDLTQEEQQKAGPELEAIAETLQMHFDRSNFAVEIHQCYLDLAAAGTACLLFEEAPIGADSAFRFTAVPLPDVWLEDSGQGRLDTVFRRSALGGEAFRKRFPKAALEAGTLRRIEAGEDVRIDVIEAVLPEHGDGNGCLYTAFRDGGAGVEIAADDAPLAEGRFQRSPFIAFRWLKAPGEAYGRSPVMKALPDIKTANKVVELVLKNASIAVTGIWQAEDDGVLNPANIKLIPGSIIPKAAGSAGLTPLEAPGKFDVSQLVLEDLRARIRHALMADALGQIDAPRMTATEVLERSAEMARILGATYGRLQSELLTPLIHRGLAILRRRREIPDVVADGRVVTLQYRSPLAQDQAKEDARNVVNWIEMTSKLGPEAGTVIDSAAAGRWLARTLGVPAELVKPAAPVGADLPGLLRSAAITLPGLAEALGAPGGLAQLGAAPQGNKTGSLAEAADVA